MAPRTNKSSGSPCRRSVASIHKSWRRLTTTSNEILKPWDMDLWSSNHSDIWQASRQLCCLISVWYNHFNIQPCGFEISRELDKYRFWDWITLRHGLQMIFEFDESLFCSYSNDNTQLIAKICSNSHALSWHYQTLYEYLTPCRNFHRVCIQGLYSPSNKTSYRKISWNLEAARFGFRLFQSLWHLKGKFATALPRCLSNFRKIERYSRYRDLAVRHLTV